MRTWFRGGGGGRGKVGEGSCRWGLPGTKSCQQLIQESQPQDNPPRQWIIQLLHLSAIFLDKICKNLPLLKNTICVSSGVELRLRNPFHPQEHCRLLPRIWRMAFANTWHRKSSPDLAHLPKAPDAAHKLGLFSLPLLLPALHLGLSAEPLDSISW